MARSLRVEYGGAIYHVTVRGNGKKAIFLSDRDRRALCKRLEDSVRSYGVRLYLYCLMNNHFHLVLETPHANLKRFMQSVLTGFTVSFNIRHRTSGHVTQGRYGARLVAGNEYLLKLSRYVHLNPVQLKHWREREVPERLSRLRSYPWSSFRAYAGLAPRQEWVTYGPMLDLVCQDPSLAGIRYQAFVEEGLAQPDEEFHAELEKSPRSIGDEQYRKWVDEQHASLEGGRRKDDISFRFDHPRVEPSKIAARVASAWGIKEADFTARRRDWEGKGVLAMMLGKYGGLTRRACASWLGVTSGNAVGYQIRQTLARMETDSRLKRRVEKLETIIGKEAS